MFTHVLNNLFHSISLTMDNRSKTTHLTDLFYSVASNFDNRKQVDVISIIFGKVLDKVNHIVFLRKLKWISATTVLRF